MSKRGPLKPSARISVSYAMRGLLCTIYNAVTRLGAVKLTQSIEDLSQTIEEKVRTIRVANSAGVHRSDMGHAIDSTRIRSWIVLGFLLAQQVYD